MTVTSPLDVALPGLSCLALEIEMEGAGIADDADELPSITTERIELCLIKRWRIDHPCDVLVLPRRRDEHGDLRNSWGGRDLDIGHVRGRDGARRHVTRRHFSGRTDNGAHKKLLALDGDLNVVRCGSSAQRGDHGGRIAQVRQNRRCAGGSQSVLDDTRSDAHEREA